MTDFVFLHSGFRTGSSWLRSKLRSHREALVFTEIFHEMLATINHDTAISLSTDAWNSRHPATAPYFVEFAPLIKPTGGVELYSEDMAYENYFPGNSLSQREKDYIQLLLGHAKKVGRFPVLTCTRSLGRLKQIKKEFGGVHILLTRDPFRQWCSYSEQAAEGNPYFVETNERILKSANEAGWLSFPPSTADGWDTLGFDAYCKHASLHLKLYNEAASDADLIVNYELLAHAEYRESFREQILSACGISLDLSDYTRSHQFSLVDFPSPVVLDQILFSFLPFQVDSMHPHVRALYEQMKRSIESYEEEAGELVRFTRQKLGDLEVTRARVGSAALELENVRGEIDRTRIELAQAQAAAQSAEAGRAVEEAKASQFQTRVAQAEEAATAVRTQYEAALQQMVQMERDHAASLQALWKDREAADKELQRKFAIERDKLRQALDETTAAGSAAAAKLARLEERATQLAGKLKRAEEEWDRSRSEAEQSRRQVELSRADADETRLQAEKVRSELDRVRAEAERARAEAAASHAASEAAGAEAHDQISRYRTALEEAGALIRRAVSERPARWQRIGEALGLTRRPPSWHALAAWTRSRSTQTGEPQWAAEQAVLGSPLDLPEAPMTLDHLLELHDEEFVRSAYRLLLNREPDPTGLRHYTRLLGLGESGIRVLADLARSPEGRSVGAELPEVRRAIRHQRTIDLLLLRPIRARLFGSGRGRAAQVRSTGNSLPAPEREIDNDATRLHPASPDHAPGPAVMQSQALSSPIVPLAVERNKSLAGLHMLADMQSTARKSPTPKGIAYSVGHTCNCSVNTGVQRVARQLARALIGNGERVVFVKWNAGKREFELLTRSELEEFGKWSGPPTHEIFGLDDYPDNGADSVFLKDVDWVACEWMFFPEVHHLGTDDYEITINQINAARALELKTAAVFYDAIPLRRAELKPMAGLHEAYMRQLMDADIIFPISNYSARDLEAFFRSYEGLDPERMPLIKPVLLPAEMPEKPRVKSANGHDKMVLCVGSIDERKNQLLLAEAFSQLNREEETSDWRLVLVGNCNPALHPELSNYTSQFPTIEWLGPISDEALAELYSRAAFCVFPSIEEGYGLPIAESLWMGRPCVCADFGPMAEIAAAGGCLTLDTSDRDALKQGLQRMMLDRKLLKKLEKSAAVADLGAWSDYASVLRSEMEAVDRGAAVLGPIYYLAQQTAEHPGNTGIQRVTRMLARSLLEIGAPLVPAKWNSSRSGLEPLDAAELRQLERFNGPDATTWAPWVEPGRSPKVGWVLMPEITPHFSPADYDSIRSFMDSNLLRGAWIFHDTIPWKMKDLYPEGAAIAHSNYMRGISKFERIFPNSEYSRGELCKFYLTENSPTVDLSHRLSTCVLPGEFPGRERAVSPTLAGGETLTILSVGSFEARKNHLTLIEAFLKARPMINREARLVLAGGAPDPAILAKIQDRIRSSNSIDWVDRPNDDTLDRLYRECDFTVYASVEEGFGLPILESNWYGKPSITSCFGAMREAAEGGGCLLVDTTNVDALASAIVRMANNDYLRLALAQDACERQTKTWTDYATEILGKIVADTPVLAPAGAKRSHTAAEQEWKAAFQNLDERPLLSVCITTYNRAAWLKRSLRALLEACAGLEDSVEVVVCDNASSDDTADVVKEFAHSNLVRYYRNAENVGMLGNLLVTSQRARGEYLWIIGDDDLVAPAGVRNVLKALKDNPGVSLVYTNYAYTREEDPKKADDLEEFFAASTPIADGGESFVGRTKEVSVRNENFFTAIYCIVFRRDHGLRAYGQYTGGEPFSSLPTCVPTTNYVLKNIMEDRAVWLAEPQIVVNLNVSWMKYAWRWILERFPEIHDTAVRHGAAPDQVDRWRTHHLPSMVHFLEDAYGSTEGGRSEFDVRNLILDVKHLEDYGEFREDFKRIYVAAVLAGHPAAKYDVDELFFI